MTITVSSAPAGTITVQPGDRTPASIVIKSYNIENVTTSEIQEGVNLYFSNARAVAALSAGQSISIDANGRINSSATSSSNYTDSNTYANVRLIGYATNANVSLKANIIDLTTATYGFRTSNANAIIYTSAGNWVFNSDGTVILPGGGKINTYDTGSVDLVAGSSETSAGLLSNNTLNLIKVDNNGAYIATTDSLYTTWEWNFGTNGSTQFPNSTLFNTNDFKILAPNVTLQSTGAVTVRASQGIPTAIGNISGYSGNWNLNPRTNLPTTVFYGLGTGLTVTISESGGVPTGVTIVNPGSGYENGQSVNVSSGNATIAFAIIVPATKDWVFNSNGVLTLPTGTITSVSSGYGLRLVNYDYASQLVWQNGNTFISGNTDVSSVTVDALGVGISVTQDGYNTEKLWQFGPTGTTQFPNSLILAPVNQSITMQSDQYSQLMWENANVTVAPNMAINSNFYVTQNSATLDIGYRDGNSTQLIKSWLWSVDGTLTLPTSGRINFDYLSISSDANVSAFYAPSGNVQLAAGIGDAQIVANSLNDSKTWTFGTNGSLTFPDGNVQATAFTTSDAYSNAKAVAAVVNTTLSNITVSGNITGNTNGFAIGYLNIPQVTASNVTLALTDAGKHYYSTTAGSLTLTIPTNANVAFETGTAISIVVQAAGNVLVNAAGGVTLYMAGNSTAANRVVSTYGMATLMKVATDTWFINGTGVS
jgi:hypothetical protein